MNNKYGAELQLWNTFGVNGLIRKTQISYRTKKKTMNKNRITFYLYSNMDKSVQWDRCASSLHVPQTYICAIKHGILILRGFYRVRPTFVRPKSIKVEKVVRPKAALGQKWLRVLSGREAEWIFRPNELLGNWTKISVLSCTISAVKYI